MLNEKLRKKYQQSSYTTVKEFQTATKCPLSLETLTSVINRGKEPAIHTFIVMAYLLSFTPEEISISCKEAGDTIFWRLIAPSSATAEEQGILEKLRKLSPNKLKLIEDLFKDWGV